MREGKKKKEREKEPNSFTGQGTKLAIGKNIQDEFRVILTTERIL